METSLETCIYILSMQTKSCSEVNKNGNQGNMLQLISFRILIITKETGDVFIEVIHEEEVDAEFPNCYRITRENNSNPSDTSRLIDDHQDVFKYFLFRHLRYIITTHSIILFFHV